MTDTTQDAFRRAIEALGGTSRAADLLGRPYRTVQNWKLGTREPPASAARALARAMREYIATLNEAAAALDFAAGRATPTPEEGSDE